MAQKVSVILTDDIDNTEAQQTLQFGFEGKNYEIDLSDENAEKLRDALAPFITAGRKVGGSSRGRSSSAGTASMDKEKMKKIREWGAKNNMPVNARGRISSTVIEAYEAAH